MTPANASTPLRQSGKMEISRLGAAFLDHPVQVTLVSEKVLYGVCSGLGATGIELQSGDTIRFVPWTSVAYVDQAR